jgi:hypothetical protein
VLTAFGNHDCVSIGERQSTSASLLGGVIRFASSRAGISHATWSRIERGLMSADNRFVLADIATALECSTADLAGHPLPPSDRDGAAAQGTVDAIRQALAEVDLGDEPMCAAPPIEALRRETALVAELRRHCDYAGVGQRLPQLLRELHAAAAGPDRQDALRLLVEATRHAAANVRYVGYPGESLFATERCRQAARELDDPVLIALAEYERTHGATGTGAYRRGLTVVSRAIDELQPHLAAEGAMEILGQLHLTAGFAALGVHRQDEAVDRVNEASAIAERTGDTATLGLHFGPTNVRFWRISMEADGGEPGRAVEIAQSTHPAVVDSPSRQFSFYSDTARALARLRRDKEAVRYLLQAERLAPVRMHASPIIVETARGMLDRARRLAGGPELRGLCGT